MNPQVIFGTKTKEKSNFYFIFIDQRYAIIYIEIEVTLMSKIILESSDLDGYFNQEDLTRIENVGKSYKEAYPLFVQRESEIDPVQIEKIEKKIISVYSEVNEQISDLIQNEKQIKLYPDRIHDDYEMFRLVSKLRNPETRQNEFLYYTQKACEKLFNLSYDMDELKKYHFSVFKTPVVNPVQNYAVQDIPDGTEHFKDTVMCVMLRGALIPSMVISKEIFDYSFGKVNTPFALFTIKRDDSKSENDMEYILDVDKSFFDIDQLSGKNLVFADPMNATGGSFITIIKHLEKQGVRAKSIRFINVISALKGILRVVRALDNVSVSTLCIDPVLNDAAYILPGLGDAGDRLNGIDDEGFPRNIIQLLSDFSPHVTSLYREPIRSIESAVLRKGK